MSKQSSGILDQWKTLQQKLADLDKAIEGDNQSIQEKRTQRAALQAQITPLAQIVKQVSDSKDTAKKEREEGSKLLGEATTYRDQVLARLKAQLSGEIVAKIEQGVKAIDDAIGQAEGVVQDAEGAAATAEQALADAQAAVKAADSERAETISALRQLPKTIQAAAADVKRLQKELDDAAKAGNLPRAYYLALDLSAALDRLKAVSTEQAEKDLLKDLDDRSAALATAQDTERQAGDDVKQKGGELKTAREALDALKKQRSQRVDELLNGTGRAQGVSTASAAAAPAQAPPAAGP